MTKTEARQWLRRIREDVREAEQAIRDGNLAALQEAMMDASGSAAEFEDTEVRGLS